MEFTLNQLQIRENWLCLDFANTVDWHASPQPEERLNTYADLVGWSQRVGLLSQERAARLRAQSERQPDLSQAVLEKAHHLREAIYGIFESVAHDEQPDEQDLHALNAYLPEAYAHLRIVPRRDEFVIAWHADPDAFDQMLWPIAQSAAALLLSDDLSRVGQCADERGCGWLFFDTSRNQSRRWCDMRDCGNRAKARRHYRRKQTPLD